MKYEIKLINIQLFAYHGIHDEEKILGNNFIFNCNVGFDSEKKITNLNETINYASVLEIINLLNKNNYELLETLLFDISKEIYIKNPLAESIYLNVVKSNPPIEKIIGSLGVTLNSSKSDFQNINI